MGKSDKWVERVRNSYGLKPERSEWAYGVLEKIKEKDPLQQEVSTILLYVLIIDIGLGKINEGSKEFFMFASNLDDKHHNVVSDLANAGVFTHGEKINFNISEYHGHPRGK